MEDLKILSEITTRYGNRNVNELEFKTPEDFKKYKAKHKMRPGTVVKVAGKDKVVGDEPKKAKRKNVPLDFQNANEKDVKKMAKKYGLEVDSIEGNPNAGLQANLIGDKEALRKFMTSDDYGMDDEDVDYHIGEFGSDAEDKDVKDKKSTNAKYLFENEKAKQGLIKSIRVDFPLQSLMTGEESMTLGDLSADKGTLKAIFGTDDFDEVQQNLTIVGDAIVYKVKGTGKEIPISRIVSRPDGIGYGSSWKLEMKLHKDFADKLQEQKDKGK